jgi:hypothetical protein
MAFGEFEVLGFSYLALTGTAVFLRRNEIRRAIRKENETRYVARIVQEKTDALLQSVELSFGIFAPAVFVAFGVLWIYDGPWWMPFLIDIPALLAGLVVVTHLQVIRFEGDDESKDLVAAKYGGHERLFLLSGIAGFVWPIATSLLLLPPNGNPDWTSIFTLAGVPIALNVGVLVLGNRAAKW